MKTGWHSMLDLATDALNGCRLHRCALHVNPYSWLQRHHHATKFTDEESYNTALVDALKSRDVDIVAITDHYQVKTSERLREACEEGGIAVLPGFEAASREGVHFLVLFDRCTSSASIDRIIGRCSVFNDDVPSPTGGLGAEEILEESAGWRALVIAAHIASSNGLFRTLNGTARAQIWRHRNLLACSLPGRPDDVQPELRPFLPQVLRNQNVAYQRDHPIALINSQDVGDPSDLERPGATTLIRMCCPSLEGLSAHP
jgi:hypothetical protein